MTFNKISVDDAVIYLSDTTYLFRLKCYLNNYDQEDGKYNFDFSELIEISTLDFHLRKLILSIMIDIEHIIRVKLINLCDNDQIDDVNKKINEFIENGDISILKIEEISHFDYKYNLYKKYENKWELWALVEILSFGSLIKLIKLLELKITFFNGLYFPLKQLRNAVAHNSLLLCNLKNTNKDFKFTHKVEYALSKNKFTEDEMKAICIPPINDFMCMMLIMYRFSDNTVITHRISELTTFFNRVKREKIISSKKLINIYKTLNRFHNIFINKIKK